MPRRKAAREPDPLEPLVPPDPPPVEPDPPEPSLEGLPVLSEAELALLEPDEPPSPPAAPVPPPDGPAADLPPIAASGEPQAPPPTDSGPPAQYSPPGDEPPDPDRPRYAQPDRFREELRGLKPEEVIERAVGLSREWHGQRGALARGTQRREELERDLQQANNAALIAYASTRGHLPGQEPPPAAPDTPPEPKPPPPVEVKQAEDGRWFLDPVAVSSLIPKAPEAPPPPAPDPGVAARSTFNAEMSSMAQEHPTYNATLTVLEQGRMYAERAVKHAAAEKGYRLENWEDTRRVIQSEGIDSALSERFQGLRFQDIQDWVEGGRLARRVVHEHAVKWYPHGVETAAPVFPRALAAPGAEPPEPIPGTPPAPEPVLALPVPALAPAFQPPAPVVSALPMANRPRNMGDRHGVSPEPDSALNRVINGSMDAFIASDPDKFRAMTTAAIRELNAEN